MLRQRKETCAPAKRCRPSVFLRYPDEEGEERFNRSLPVGGRLLLACSEGVRVHLSEIRISLIGSHGDLA